MNKDKLITSIKEAKVITKIEKEEFMLIIEALKEWREWNGEKPEDRYDDVILGLVDKIKMILLNYED
tara:strand:+ start:730 stop:930 length:201 start_codon:yes stop_codon:yes gene_type:complete